MKDHTIRPELREWILSTARSGYGPGDLLRLMRDAGYGGEQSRQILSRVLNMPMTAFTAAVKQSSKVARTRHPKAPQEMVDGHTVRISLATEAPVIRLLDGLLTLQECDELIE